MGFLDLFRSPKPTSPAAAKPGSRAPQPPSTPASRAEKRPVDWTLGDYEAQKRQEDSAAQVRGRHYVDWVPELDALRTAKKDDEALELLLDCIAAAERHAKVQKSSPAPAYTVRAAIIYARRQDYAAEIAVLERWNEAAPARYRGDSGKVGSRLVKAREKLAESSGS